MEQPKIIWPLDSVHRGRNSGSLGQLFNLAIDKVTWTDAGPLGMSVGNFVRFAIIPKSFWISPGLLRLRCEWKRMMQISGCQSSKPMIKMMCSTFTFGSFLPIIKISFTSAYLWVISTITNNADRLKWRYIVCTHDGESNVRFYLSGNEWPISYRQSEPYRWKR